MRQIAIDALGKIHIGYWDATNKELKICDKYDGSLADNNVGYHRSWK